MGKQMDNKKVNYQPYCIEDRRYANSLWNEWQNGLIQYSRDNEWDYSFDNELSGREAEATPLSKLVWIQILKHNGIEVEESQDGKHTNTYFLKLKSDSFVHFDIMNNPKLRYSIANQLYKEDICVWKKWVDLYHTIGNFSPTLWIPGINLQVEHLHKDERWDCFLKYLQKNWNSWSSVNKDLKTISFERYMKLSVMWIYVKGKYRQFRDEVQGDRLVEEISDDEWIKFYEENSGLTGSLFEFIDLKKEAYLIPDLIEYRGRCILALCRKENNKELN